MHVSRFGIVSLLVVVSLLIVLFTGLLLNNVFQLATQPVSHKTPVPTTAQHQDDDSPLSIAGVSAPLTLKLPGSRSVLYERQNGLYVVPTSGGKPELLPTPGYIYNRAIPPIITPTGQILYSGDGLWLTAVLNGSPQQIATLDAGQILTSVALSTDGTKIAWSTEPLDGAGNAFLYAGPLQQPTVVYQHAASDCPCFRIFSFYNTAGRAQNSALLLTDDKGDHNAVRFGLWMFDLTKNYLGNSPMEPRLVLDENPQQGPLIFLPRTNTLLYSSFEGVVPQPTDGSVPAELATFNYANSLAVTTITGSDPALGPIQTLLTDQHNLSNKAQYRWVTTPCFTLDGRTLLYIEFSSDTQPPFDRHSALYGVSITTSGKQVKLGRPQLLATSNDRFVELGAWIDDHTISLYSDGTLYGFDLRTGAMASILEMNVYAHVFAVVG